MACSATLLCFDGTQEVKAAVSMRIPVMPLSFMGANNPSEGARREERTRPAGVRLWRILQLENWRHHLSAKRQRSVFLFCLSLNVEGLMRRRRSWLKTK